MSSEHISSRPILSYVALSPRSSIVAMSRTTSFASGQWQLLSRTYLTSPGGDPFCYFIDVTLEKLINKGEEMHRVKRVTGSLRGGLMVNADEGMEREVWNG